MKYQSLFFVLFHVAAGYSSNNMNSYTGLRKSLDFYASATSLDLSPELSPPSMMYQNAVTVGERKGGLSPIKTLILGFLSGCHIAFGAYLLLSVGGNCPEMAKNNPGLQKILMGAFGLPFGLMMTVIGGKVLNIV